MRRNKFGSAKKHAVETYNDIIIYLNTPEVELFIESRGTDNFDNPVLEMFREMLDTININGIGDELYYNFPNFRIAYNEYAKSGMRGNIDYLIFTLFNTIVRRII